MRFKRLIQKVRRLLVGSKRLLTLKQQRARITAARKLAQAQRRAMVGLGAKALIPHGAQRSAYLYKR
jgi:hypothetical protein